LQQDGELDEAKGSNVEGDVDVKELEWLEESVG
jgi:hypothetical protein